MADNLVITNTASTNVIYSLQQVNKPHIFSNYSAGTTPQTLLTIGANTTTDVLAAGKVLDNGVAPTNNSHLTNKLYVDTNFLNKSQVTAQTVASNVTFSGTVTSTSLLTASNGLTVTAGGLTVTAGGLTASNGLTVTADGLTVTAGGLTVTAGGLTVTAGTLAANGGITGTINTTAQNSITTMTGLTSIGSSGQTTTCSSRLGIGMTPVYPLQIAATTIYSQNWSNEGTLPTRVTIGWGTINQYQTDKTNLPAVLLSAHFANIIAATGYIAFSDRRIKTNIIDIDDVSALETLRQIKPRRYNYIDTVNRSSEPVWGFIAQEVRDTLPYSTVLTKSEIPNIFDMADVRNNNTITLINKSTSLFSRDASGNLYQLLLKDITSKDIKVTIAEIIDDKTFTITEPLTAEQTGEESPKIFVYGSFVDDFHNLDKNAIFTIATAALQELDREYQQTKQEVITLKGQNEALQNRLDAIEQRLANAGL